MPMPKPWEIISNYESQELVRDRYAAKHGREANAGQGREIASAFIQARHYYKAAEEADRAVKPLLLYYGVVSLSRGLVLFLKRGAREATLAQAHGLSPRGWQTVLSQPNPDIGALRVEVTGSGSFPELVEATANRNLLRSGSSGVNQKLELGAVPAGSSFSLDDLLSRVPDVYDQYTRWKSPRCLRMSSQPIPGGTEAVVTIFKRDALFVTEALVMEVIGRDYCEIVSNDAEKVQVRTTKNQQFVGSLSDLVKESFLGIGDIFIAQQLAPDLNLSKTTQLFAASYVLGMIVRYNPSFWMDFIHQRVSDAGLPTVIRLIDCLESMFPVLVVDFLEEKNV